MTPQCLHQGAMYNVRTVATHGFRYMRMRKVHKRRKMRCLAKRQLLMRQAWQARRPLSLRKLSLRKLSRRKLN